MISHPKNWCSGGGGDGDRILFYAANWTGNTAIFVSVAFCFSRTPIRAVYTHSCSVFVCVYCIGIALLWLFFLLIRIGIHCGCAVIRVHMYCVSSVCTGIRACHGSLCACYSCHLSCLARTYEIHIVCIVQSRLARQYGWSYGQMMILKLKFSFHWDAIHWLSIGEFEAIDSFVLDAYSQSANDGHGKRHERCGEMRL